MENSVQRDHPVPSIRIYRGHALTGAKGGTSRRQGSTPTDLVQVAAP